MRAAPELPQGLRVEDLQSELMLERVEVAVAVQESVALFQAEGSDPTVNGSAHCVALLSESAVVLSRCNREIVAAGREDLKFQQLVANSDKVSLLSDSLKNFAQN